ncbi:MAG: 2-amino-4-hydroxy-6-hydroxymethyldihydropteridine diphosphokinase [Bacteroidetes bacterium]|nr:2-amino-4-hydroxy-6-hydroxymethyldihydropteridine diphosphokinase [Bacteroidota bacterium]
MRYHKAYIQTGSNLGNRFQQLETVLHSLVTIPATILKASSIYETAPWGLTEQPPFLNQVLQIETLLEPSALMDALLSIEQQMGRIRGEKMGPRIIDLDILLYDDLVIQTASLQIPHPLMSTRRFVLEPLCEINPDLLHPVHKQTIATLLNNCSDTLPVRKMTRQPFSAAT